MSERRLGREVGNLLYFGVALSRCARLRAIANGGQTLWSRATHALVVLDFNAYWTSFITYCHPGAGGAANLLPTMDRSSQRYLTPDDRDFFDVYVR